MRTLVAATVAALLLAACSTGSDLSVTTADSTTPADEPAPDSATPVEEPAPDTDAPADEPAPDTDAPADEPPGPAIIDVGTPGLLGVAIGSDDDEAIALLTDVLGPPTEDSGWGEGCPLNGIDERYVTWGGLGAQFEVTETGEELFARWTYRLDFETGGAIPGGPTPDQIVLPDGIALGDSFSSAAAAYGFAPAVDEVFGIAIYIGNSFTLLTSEASVDAPITEVYVPIVAFCE